MRVNAINSTALHVAWKPPQDKDRNGIIMGYHIHVQETKEEVCVNICSFILRISAPLTEYEVSSQTKSGAMFLKIFSFHLRLAALGYFNIKWPYAQLDQFSPPQNAKISKTHSLPPTGSKSFKRAPQVRCNRFTRIQRDRPSARFKILRTSSSFNSQR